MILLDNVSTIFYFACCNLSSKYSRTSTNGHLSTTASFFFVPADSSCIAPGLILFTTVTATKVCPNCQTNLSTTSSFFQRLMKKSRMPVLKFAPYGALMINRGNRILLLFHYTAEAVSIHTILMANVANRSRLVPLTF